MSDFLLSFKPLDNETISGIVRKGSYLPYIKSDVLTFDQFTLVITTQEDNLLWGPSFTSNQSVFACICGRIALEKTEWDEAGKKDFKGGLACNAILERYLTEGIKSSFFSNLNGNYVVIIYDKKKSELFLITDRCGMQPCFCSIGDQKKIIIGSHPDTVAQAAGVVKKWDMVSLTEFIVTGKVSHPHSYYESVKSLDFGAIYNYAFLSNNPQLQLLKKYFSFNFQIHHGLSEWEIAEELAASFKKAVTKRTLPIFGKSAVSLSAGLDSRSILCATGDNPSITTFCFFDEKNLEFSLSESIAKTKGVEFIPFKRDYEHYGSTAELGTHISGAMGDFGSNHYLGFADKFKSIGIDNLICGFYCDYLFKALLLDKKENKWLRTERMSSFNYSAYMPFYWFSTGFCNKVRERLEERFPQSLIKRTFPEDRLEIENLKIFPLCYEPDHQETVIPQRVLGTFLPIVDNDIIDVYLKTPPHYKLNASMYSKMTELICGKEISRIMNINTGTRVNAPLYQVAIKRNLMALKRKLSPRNTIVSDVSWPNWEYYLFNSDTISRIWNNQHKTARDFFITLLDFDPYTRPIKDYCKNDCKLFLRLFTLKMWIDQRNLK